MELIIDIPEENYKRLMEYDGEIDDFWLEAVVNGTPLDDIKAEIQKSIDEDKAIDTENAKVEAIALMWCLEVIDKHIGGKE